MSISTYAELQTAVTGWMQRSGVVFDGTDYVPDLITMGEKYIFRHARTRDMETSLSVALSSGVGAVPADFVALKYAYLDHSPVYPVQPKAASWIITAYPTRSADDVPQFIAIDGSNFIFGPYPDSDYTLMGTYYKRLTSITSSANALFTSNPDLYLFAALAECKAFMKDNTYLQIWTQKRDQILQDVNNENNIGNYSGGPLTMAVML